MTMTNQSGPASEAESDSTHNATNKLDPLLMLGAFRAKLEKGADFTAATTETVVKVSDLPIGLYSLAGAMSSFGAERFVREDLVPVLVETQDHDGVVAQVAKLGGQAAPVGRTAVSARDRARRPGESGRVSLCRLRGGKCPARLRL